MKQENFRERWFTCNSLEMNPPPTLVRLHYYCTTTTIHEYGMSTIRLLNDCSMTTTTFELGWRMRINQSVIAGGAVLPGRWRHHAWSACSWSKKQYGCCLCGSSHGLTTIQKWSLKIHKILKNKATKCNSPLIIRVDVLFTRKTKYWIKLEMLRLG